MDDVLGGDDAWANVDQTGGTVNKEQTLQLMIRIYFNTQGTGLFLERKPIAHTFHLFVLSSIGNN